MLRELCAFLGVDYAPELLAYHERRDRLAAILPFDEHHAHARQPPMKGLRDWRTQMSRADLALFERVAGDTLERAGYVRGA